MRLSPIRRRTRPDPLPSQPRPGRAVLRADLQFVADLVERWFAELTNRKLRRSAYRSLKALTDDLVAWTAAWNDNPRPFVWRKTADEILDSVKRYLAIL